MLNADMISNLSHDELFLNLTEQLEVERKASHLALLLLKEIRSRRIYLERGYANMFIMLIEQFKLSETSAYQRLKALDLMLDVPEIEEHLKSGEVNLSTLSMAQRQIRRDEKLSGHKIAKSVKSEIVSRIIGKTQAQAEVELMQILPNAASHLETHERRISDSAVRLSLTVPDALRDKLCRLKEIWAHVNSEMDYLEVIERSVDLSLEKCDPLLRAAKKEKSKINVKTDAQSQKPLRPEVQSEAKEEAQTETKEEAQLDAQASSSVVLNQTIEKSAPYIRKRKTYFAKETDRQLWQRAGAQCEHFDTQTGRRCSSRFGLQRDHIIPWAKGGSDHLINLRLLCKPHNLMMARKHFGGEVKEVKGGNESSVHH